MAKFAPDLTGLTKEEIIKILDEVRHPIEIAVFGKEDDSANYFNCGAILRTCHAFLVKRVHFINRSKFYKKATMGTHKYEEIIKYDSVDSFLEATNNKNLITFERNPLTTSDTLYDFKYPENSILCFGSEKTGIPTKVLENSKAIVSIEQYGIHNDMNLSNAVSIALYDWCFKYNRNILKEEK